MTAKRMMIRTLTVLSIRFIETAHFIERLKYLMVREQANAGNYVNTNIR
jgi:hypothetical protein